MTGKQRLRSKALKLWYRKYLKDKCEICPNTYVLQGHHYFYRSNYTHLMFDKDNHITLCKSCHFLLHHQDPKTITNRIIEVRGKRWLNRLTKKAYTRPTSSYQTLTYYQEQLTNLTRQTA